MSWNVAYCDLSLHIAVSNLRPAAFLCELSYSEKYWKEPLSLQNIKKGQLKDAVNCTAFANSFCQTSDKMFLVWFYRIMLQVEIC